MFREERGIIEVEGGLFFSGEVLGVKIEQSSSTLSLYAVTSDGTSYYIGEVKTRKEAVKIARKLLEICKDWRYEEKEFMEAISGELWEIRKILERRDD